MLFRRPTPVHEHWGPNAVLPYPGSYKLEDLFACPCGRYYWIQRNSSTNKYFWQQIGKRFFRKKMKEYGFQYEDGKATDQ